MWIKRDLYQTVSSPDLLEAVVVQGPRQVGKSSLLVHSFPEAKFLGLDDLNVRERARKDPQLLLALHDTGPIIFDEFQCAPELLFEIKLQIDKARRAKHSKENAVPVRPRFFLSGSNQIEIEKSLRETLAGRASIFALHGLSLHEIRRSIPDATLSRIIFRGGFPELYSRTELQPIDYINDYISTFVEKDIARSAGVQKLDEFLLVTRLLAARVGELVSYESMARDSGVAPKTIAEWCDILERARITTMLPVYSSNLNSRLIKTPKIYFIDCGLLVRLQGHIGEEALLSTPQAGHVFENLVISEAIKTRDHFKRPWKLSYWRTKEKEEVDLIVESGQRRILVEIKLAVQNIHAAPLSAALLREFGKEVRRYIITPAGSKEPLDHNTTRLSLNDLTPELLTVL